MGNKVHKLVYSIRQKLLARHKNCFFVAGFSVIRISQIDREWYNTPVSVYLSQDLLMKSSYSPPEPPYCQVVTSTHDLGRYKLSGHLILNCTTQRV